VEPEVRARRVRRVQLVASDRRDSPERPEHSGRPGQRVLPELAASVVPDRPVQPV
jgi:hypothetical protein